MLVRPLDISFPDRFGTLTGPFRHLDGNAWICERVPGGNEANTHLRSTLQLFEDRAPLLAAFHQTIAMQGDGRYCYWGNELIFSATDNTNPNTNGRKYTYDFGLDLDTWDRARAARDTRLWKFHPRADYFLARGGTEIPPPYQCNVGLTNKCNLRCEICGSQKTLDATGVRRRHMDRATFEAVADTVFPVLTVVELNSQGDPLCTLISHSSSKGSRNTTVISRCRRMALYSRTSSFRGWSRNTALSCCRSMRLDLSSMRYAAAESGARLSRASGSFWQRVTRGK